MPTRALTKILQSTYAPIDLNRHVSHFDELAKRNERGELAGKDEKVFKRVDRIRHDIRALRAMELEETPGIVVEKDSSVKNEVPPGKEGGVETEKVEEG